MNDGMNGELFHKNREDYKNGLQTEVSVILLQMII
jgi:hypothetical protein